VDPLGTDFLLRPYLALVDLLFQPSLDGLSTVPHVTAHSVANWAVTLVSPAVQGVNGDAQHFRDIRKRHQLIANLECHDHLPSLEWQLVAVWDTRVSVVTWAAVTGTFGQAARPYARPGSGPATFKDLSREATAGGRSKKNRSHITRGTVLMDQIEVSAEDDQQPYVMNASEVRGGLGSLLTGGLAACSVDQHV
jgi:hypothetical protein